MKTKIAPLMLNVVLLLSLLWFPSELAHGQTTPISGQINIYTPIVSLDRCGNIVTVATSAGFAPGDLVLLIQLKGGVIDSSNASTFGTILDYDHVGNFEFATIGAITGNQITFREDLVRQYNDNKFAQMVKVPRYGSADVVGTLSAAPWNGTSGGVLALDVADTLSLHADIDLSGMGFHGGELANIIAPGIDCNVVAYLLDPNLGQGGAKGEGIVPIATDTMKGGRGPAANGGGGGDNHNSGGAGGGNFGAGGHGGREWSGCPDVIDNGGIGGLPLDYTVSRLRIYMGGGGGAGHQNSGLGTAGTNGGGIVVIRARILNGNGFTIRANGAPNNALADGDGAGGGGAGGALLLDVGAVSSQVKVEAMGGAGGRFLTGGLCHGPGGGGGGGALLLRSGSVPANVSVALNGGRSGINFCQDSTWGATAGEDGGVITGVSVPEGTVTFGPSIAALELPFITLTPGDTVTIPVALRVADNLTFAGANNYRITFSFDKHLLAPLPGTPPGIIQGDRRVYTISGTHTDSSNVLARFRFVALLGPVDTTTLRIDSFAFDTTTCPVFVSKFNGKLTINVCREGGARLVDAGAGASLKPTAPDPVSGVADIGYQTVEQGITRLALFDMLGRRAALLFDGPCSPGAHTARLNASALPDGLYLCILETPTQRISQVIRVAH